MGAFQIVAIAMLVLLGLQTGLGDLWYLAVAVFAACVIRQQALIRQRERGPYMTAFRNNVWAGLALFLGTVTDFALRPNI